MMARPSSPQRRDHSFANAMQRQLTYALSGCRSCGKSTELLSRPLAPGKISKKARLMRHVLPKLLAMLRCGL
jgi:hypothetical protein